MITTGDGRFQLGFSGMTPLKTANQGSRHDISRDFSNGDRDWAFPLGETQEIDGGTDAFKLVPCRSAVTTFGASLSGQCSFRFGTGTFRRPRVLHKCANPACPIPLRKLSQGKLFLVETEPLGVSELRRGATRPASSSH